MITKEDVIAWMRANPKEFREIYLTFTLGATAGELVSAAGYSVDDVRATLDLALSVLTEGYQNVTGAGFLRAVPPPKKE